MSRSGSQPQRCVRLTDHAAGWFLASSEPTFGYLPDGIFVTSGTSRRTYVWRNELRFADEPAPAPPAPPALPTP